MSQQLSDTDREILREEGVSLPRAGKRKRRRPERETEGQGKVDSRAEAEWREVRDLMDPNPQLNGVALGKYAPKVTRTYKYILGGLTCVDRVIWRRRWMNVLREETLRRQWR